MNYKVITIMNDLELSSDYFVGDDHTINTDNGITYIKIYKADKVVYSNQTSCKVDILFKVNKIIITIHK